MRIDRKKGSLIAAILASIACLLQVVGVVRYVGRLPDDWTGIGLYIASIVAFAVITLGFLVQWRRL